MPACARPRATALASGAILALSLLLVPSIGAEFMPKLDEGALWVRATMPYTISYEEASKISPQIRAVLRSFPVVTTVSSELGRPDDGTDSTGFFNDEFFVGLKPYSQWNGKYRDKADLIAAIDKQLQAFPGIQFNYTQPAEDAVDEAETGLKSALAVKIFGADLHVLQDKGKAIKQVLEQVRGIGDVTLVHELGQPSLAIKLDRAKLARYGLNVDDVNGLIETAIGGSVATQVVQGEKQFDLVVRLDRQYRDDPQAIGNIPVATAGGAQIPLKELARIGVANGASFIYRENNSRYIGVQFSVEGRDLAGAVEDAMAQVAHSVHLAPGYRLDWGGEYKEYTASRAQMNVIVPVTLFVIFLLLFVLYGNCQVPAHHRARRAVVRARRRDPRAVAHGYAVLGVVRHRLHRAVRRLGTHRRGLHFLRQRAAPQRHGDGRGDTRRRDPAPAPDHDDGAGRRAGAAARRARIRRRHRFATPIRARHRRRHAYAPAHQHLPDARAVCAGGEGGGSVGGLGSPTHGDTEVIANKLNT